MGPTLPHLRRRHALISCCAKIENHPHSGSEQDFLPWHHPILNHLTGDMAVERTVVDDTMEQGLGFVESI